MSRGHDRRLTLALKTWERIAERYRTGSMISSDDHYRLRYLRRHGAELVQAPTRTTRQYTQTSLLDLLDAGHVAPAPARRRRRGAH